MSCVPLILLVRMIIEQLESLVESRSDVVVLKKELPRLLVIVADCCFSGAWVQKLAKLYRGPILLCKRHVGLLGIPSNVCERQKKILYSRMPGSMTSKSALLTL